MLILFTYEHGALGCTTMLTLGQHSNIMSQHNVLTDFSGNLQPSTRITVLRLHTHTFISHSNSLSAQQIFTVMIL